MNKAFFKVFYTAICFSAVFCFFGISNNALAQSTQRQNPPRQFPGQPVPANPNTQPVQQRQDSTNKSSPAASNIPANQTPSGVQINRQSPEDSYKVFQRPPSSIFGSELFSLGSLSFQPNLRIATPTNYILGPDDELIINVSGFQETTVKATVLPEGTIFIPQVGKINVNGLSVDAATAAIRSAMVRTAYPSIANGNSKLTITLSNIKSIHVTIIGGFKPGDYTISSLTTLFNALFICGGPGDINTYRGIQLIRGGRVLLTIDLYQFLTKGIIQGNVLLKEGDVINMPVYKTRVTISGQVKKSGLFELKNGETFNDLLFYAGGYTDIAYKASVKVKQINDVEKTIKDIPKAELALYHPSNGDSFSVDAILNNYVNAVTISGSVYRPGEFELTPNITVTSLIKRAGGLKEDVFTERAVVNRFYPDGRKLTLPFNVTRIMNGTDPDIALIKGDVVNIATATEFINSYNVQILGEVRKPGAIPYTQNLTLKDAFFFADGFTDAASSYHVEVSRRLTIERSNKSADTIAKVFDLTTTKDLSIDKSDFALQPFDIITIRKNPGYIEQQKAYIVGEVNYPGAYTIESKKERISDLLKRAGGLTSFAYPKGVYLIRADLNNVIQNKTVQKVQSSIRDTSAFLRSDISPYVVALPEDEEVLKTNSRIAVDINTILERPGSIGDYILEPNDSLQVLKANPLIKVSGEVLASTKTSFIQGMSLRYYLSQAGGTTDFAHKRKIYVVYANGHIARTHNGIFGLFRSYPKVETGAEVIVPKKNKHKGRGTAETVGIGTALLSLVSLIIVTISTIKK